MLQILYFKHEIPRLSNIISQVIALGRSKKALFNQFAVGIFIYDLFYNYLQRMINFNWLNWNFGHIALDEHLLYRDYLPFLNLGIYILN